jgi:hypothetical protein
MWLTSKHSMRCADSGRPSAWRSAMTPLFVQRLVARPLRKRKQRVLASHVRPDTPLAVRRHDDLRLRDLDVDLCSGNDEPWHRVLEIVLLEKRRQHFFHGRLLRILRKEAAIADMPAAAHHHEVDAGDAVVDRAADDVGFDSDGSIPTYWPRAHRSKACAPGRDTALASSYCSAPTRVHLVAQQPDHVVLAPGKNSSALFTSCAYCSAEISAVHGAVQRGSVAAGTAASGSRIPVSSHVRSLNTRCSSWMLSRTHTHAGNGPK